MDWLSDELLFRGGAVTALISLIGVCIFFFISYMGKKKLNAKLDEEYGKIDRIKQRK